MTRHFSTLYLFGEWWSGYSLQGLTHGIEGDTRESLPLSFRQPRLIFYIFTQPIAWQTRMTLVRGTSYMAARGSMIIIPSSMWPLIPSSNSLICLRRLSISRSRSLWYEGSGRYETIHCLWEEASSEFRRVSCLSCLRSCSLFYSLSILLSAMSKILDQFPPNLVGSWFACGPSMRNITTPTLDLHLSRSFP